MNVIVIGAGVVGLSVAYELASRGARVRVVDHRGPGQGATRASAGILAPHIEARSDALLTLGLAGLAAYDRFVDRLRGSAHTAVEYRRTGTLQVALDAAEAEELSAASARLWAAGVPHALLSGDESRQSEALLSPQIVAGLELRQHGYVAVPGLMAALEEMTSGLGGTLMVARARGVEERRGHPVVVTGEGALEADAVVIAAGSWSGDLAVRGGPPAPVRPIKGQLLHLRLAKPPVTRVVWGARGYLVPWADGSVLVGATVEDVGFDERVTVAGVRQMLELGHDLVPALDDAILAEVRVGLRPATADELPVIGASATMPGVFYATGHYRSGVLLAPLTAALVADLVLNGKAGPELALTRPDRVGL